jgi:hypothetical protein
MSRDFNEREMFGFVKTLKKLLGDIASIGNTKSMIEPNWITLLQVLTKWYILKSVCYVSTIVLHFELA